MICGNKYLIPVATMVFVSLLGCVDPELEYLNGRVVKDARGCAFTVQYTVGKGSGIKLIFNEDETDASTCRFRASNNPS